MCGLKGMQMTTQKFKNEIKTEGWAGGSWGKNWSILFLILFFWTKDDHKQYLHSNWNRSARLCFFHENFVQAELHKLMKGILWYSCLWYVETGPSDLYCLFPRNGFKSDPLSSTPLHVQNSGASVHRPLHSHYLWCWSTRFLPHCISLLVYWIWTNVGNQRKMQL